ncbi:MAG: DUF2339 domain-containing protein [Gammaproteobacteria bacterium]
MNDFFGFIVFILILTPILLFVMLAVLMARQNRYRDELARSLRNVQDTLSLFEKNLFEDRKQLKELLQRTLQPTEETQQPASSEPQKPAPQAHHLRKPKVESTFEYKHPTVESRSEPKQERPPEKPWNPSSWQPAEPGRFERAAKKILREIWNWIIVGEGHRPEGVAMEYAVASNWLLRIGVLILVTGIGFFLKYSIDNDLLGERARVALAVLAGIGMIIGGVRLTYGRYHLFSQGLLGGGIAVLYFSVFAAFSFYHLLEVYTSFALMILVTACAAALAIRLDSMLVALFALIGGYCTPILLSTGQVNYVGLFGYMLLLGIGLLAINGYKQWHLLNFLSFFFNYLLFFGSLARYEPQNFWEVMPFLIAFFILYSTMVFLFCLAHRVKSTLLDLLALIVNVAIFFITARHLVLAEYGPTWVAVITLALAAFYIAHVYFCLVRRVQDRELLLSFIGLAAFFVTLTLPLLLTEQWITVSWSLQAVVMLWMAGKLKSAFLRQATYLLYLIVLARFCFIDLPGQYGIAIDSDQPFGDFMLGLLERVISFGIPIGSLALAFKLIEKPAPASSLALDEGSDVPLWLKDDWLLQAALLAVAGMLFIVVQLELYRSLGYLYPPLQLPMLTLVWLALCLFLLLRYLTAPGDFLLKTLRIFMIAVVVKLLLFDLPSWGVHLGYIAVGENIWTLRYGGAYSFQLALIRLLDFAAIIGFLLFAFRRLSTTGENAGDLRSWLGGAALVLLFTFLSLELNSMLYQYVPGLRSGGVSILWSLFALTLVLTGIKKRVPALRLTGLALFALVAWKVFFIDLARLDQVYRIVAFLILGLLALGGAFAYMRYQQAFVTTAADEKQP